jgi:hypothetical protein
LPTPCASAAESFWRREKRGAEEEQMRILENRQWRHELIGKIQDYERLLADAEAQLTTARKRAETELGPWVERAKQAIAHARELGHKALGDVDQAARMLRSLVEEFKAREAGEAGLSGTGRKVVRRAKIEAQALRHGVKVGLRMARRVSKRGKATTKA